MKELSILELLETPKQAVLKALSKINEHTVNGGSNYEILDNKDKYNILNLQLEKLLG